MFLGGSVTKRLFKLAAHGAAFLVSVTMVPAGISYADVEQELQERQKIIDEVKRRTADEKLNNKAMEAGFERSTLCGTCHGPDGNARKPEYPNLAGQNPAYIVEQMAKFKDGRRKSFVMEALVKSFTMEDKINLAIYFTSQNLKPIEGVDDARAAKGELKYKEVCARCHGENGRGEMGYARVAGQQIDYVKMNLSRFRDNALKATDFDESKRTDARMEQVTQFLSDDDIENLAHFIAQMK